MMRVLWKTTSTCALHFLGFSFSSPSISGKVLPENSLIHPQYDKLRKGLYSLWEAVGLLQAMW